MDKFEQYFNQYYAFLRRNFWDFVTVVNQKNFFTWATISLKVPSANIGYYLSKDSAVAVRTPDGKLPADLTDFYFNDIPVVFNNQSDAYFPAFLANQQFKLNRVGDVVLQLNVWLEGKGYTAIYIVYDPANMDIDPHAVSLDDADAAIDTLTPLHLQLMAIAADLQKNHNTVLNALLSAQYGDAAADQQRQQLQQISDNILTLRNSNAYLVKISPDCNAPANSESIFGGNIIINAAVAFSAMPAIAADPMLAADLLSKLSTQGVLSAMHLQQIKQVIVNSTDATGTTGTATPTPEDTTAPANKKSNAIFWVLGIGTAIYLLSNTGSKNGTAKK